MFARALTPVALACALAAPLSAAAAQGFQYAAGTSQYRLVSDAKITQSVMGQSNETDISSGQKFTVALAKQGGDTLSMSVTIDSISQTTPMGPLPGTDGLVGKTVKALLSNRGEFYHSTSPEADSVPALASVADQLEHLLPRIRGTLAAGTTWTDTNNVSTSQGGIEVKRQVISKFTVAGDTTVGSSTAWKITRASNSTFSGSGSIQGQNASIGGTSTGTGVVLVGHDGTFIGGAGSENQTAKLTLPDAGVSYDLGTVATTKIDRIR